MTVWEGNLKDFTEEERQERLAYEQDNRWPLFFFVIACVLSASSIALGLYFYPVATVIALAAMVVFAFWLVGREFRE